MNQPPAKPEPDSQSKAAMRFAYPSGSKPLEGYTIKRGVGRGGFGEVYFAVSDAGKEVALKLIRRNLEVELRGVTQCLNLKHHNLIALYDIRTDEHNDRWVVMEYVSGESLDDAIDRHPQGMPLDKALHWFSGIATGVAYLHDHGIVHRDLKPANIFMDENTVKIGDYGLSKFISCSRRSGQTESVGTVHYMAPEIANGRYGKEIDTYALGIILYEMLTGHVPFEGESVGEVLMKHLTAEPDLNALDEPYRGIVEGAMAKDPELRIKSVTEMLNRLPSTTRPLGTASTSNGQSLAEPAAPVPPVNVVTNDEEPIWASLRNGWRDLDRRYHESKLHPLLKAVLGVSVLVILLASSKVLFALLIPTTLIYLCYRAVRAIVVVPGQRVADNLAQTNPTVPGTPAVPPTLQESSLTKSTQTKPSRRHKRYRRQTWQRQLREHLAAKPMRQRVTELVGGMLVASVVAAIASLLVCMTVAHVFSMELVVWMTLVATLASWAVMVPARLTEGKIEDQAPLRFVQLVAGALLGVLAWGIAELLMLSLPVAQGAAVTPQGTMMGNVLKTSSDLYQGYQAGMVRLPLQAYTAYFAFLFVIIAWWRQAEATRTSRVSLGSVVWCGLVAWLLHLVWWFPQPLGLLLASVIAFTIQLSSTWLPPSQRQALAEREA